MNCSALSGDRERDRERGLTTGRGETDGEILFWKFPGLPVRGGDVDVDGVCPVLFRLFLTGGEGNRVGDEAGFLLLSVVGGDVEDAEGCAMLC